MVSYLSEELVRQGHEVTLFASGNSTTSARLIACTAQAIRLNPAILDHVPNYIIMLDKLRRSAHLFDVLHFHIDALHFPLFRDLAARTITTLHGRPVCLTFLPLSCLSRNGARFNFRRHVDRSPRPTSPRRSITDCRLICSLPITSRAADIWRFWDGTSSEKHPDRAIAIANALGFPLKIAAKVDKADEAYFRR